MIFLSSTSTDLWLYELSRVETLWVTLKRNLSNKLGYCWLTLKCEDDIRALLFVLFARLQCRCCRADPGNTSNLAKSRRASGYSHTVSWHIVWLRCWLSKIKTLHVACCLSFPFKSHRYILYLCTFTCAFAAYLILHLKSNLTWINLLLLHC